MFVSVGTPAGWVILSVLVLLTGQVPCSKGQPTISGSREELSEERLINWLMATYVKDARPVLQHTDAVAVSVKFSFVRVEDLNEASDTFVSSLFIVQMWNDPRLKWNMSNYDGLQTVRLQASKLWIPDLVLYNVAYQTPPQSLYEDIVTVTHDGNVVWVPMLTLYSTCPMDLTDFPNDVQTCSLVFGSLMHTSWEVNVTFISNKSEMDVVLSEGDTFYPVHPHPQWELVDNKAWAKLSLKKYDCCQKPYTLITISARLRRRPQFYHHLAVGPAAVIGFLVPVIYLVPAHGQNKTLVGLLLLLSLVMLMNILQQAIPFNHGSLPKICSFYLGTMILTCASIFASVVVANLSVRGTRRKPLPAWVHTIFLGKHSLRYLLCIGDYSPVGNLYVSELHAADSTAVGNHGAEGGLTGEQLLQNLEAADSEKNTAYIARYVKFIVGKMAADVSYRNINQDWEELGRVIDRCLFLVFFALYIFTASSLL